MRISFSELKKTLHESGESYRLLPVGDGRVLLVWEGRGRFYGPFDGEDSVGVLWTPSALASAAAYRDFCGDGGWNVGGDRFWIAPEFPFFTKERARFNESYTVQPGVDPGDCHFAPSADHELLLESGLEAELFETDGKHKRFFVQRLLRPCRNPLRESRRFSELMDGVSFCGFTQEMLLEDHSPEEPMELEIWDLCQVRDGGEFLVPYLGKELEYVDYYAPSAGVVLSAADGRAAVKVSSCAEHKVGFKAYQTFGRVGYLLPEEDGSFSFFVRNYRNAPSDRYIKEPSDRPGENGCSLFIYMNDTRGDGFAELETTGETFGTDGRDCSRLTLDYWFFRGKAAALSPISEALLGLRLRED